MDLDQIARTAITWLVTLLVPLVLLLTGIRLLLFPWFIHYEYNRPAFPADSYGFTLQDRLQWSQVSLDYLLNDQDITFLSSQRFADGTPLYNDRELSHMLDVKNLVQLALKVWTAAAGVLIGLGLAAWGARWAQEYRTGLSRGGWVTAGLVIAILVFVIVSFDWLFTAFHRVFFEGETWIFLFSDSLIRLFPIPLWQDAFLFLGGFSLVTGVLLGLLARKVP
jgi:integral membrane protein (TIGR01906 family)